MKIQNRVYSNNNFADKVSKNTDVSSFQQSTALTKTPFTSIYDPGFSVRLFNRAKIVSFSNNSHSSPAGKLLDAVKPEKYTYNQNFLNEHQFCGIGKGAHKKWVFAEPADLLKRPVADAINDILRLSNPDLKKIPAKIESPPYDDKWGRRANYIEIIPRALGKIQQNENGNTLMREGILGAIKLLPAIPASQDGVANCVILNGLFPTMYGDGYAHGDNEESKIYQMKFNQTKHGNKDSYEISNDLVSEDLIKKGMNPDEQVKAFNDLAHLRGLKTGVFLVIGDGQIAMNDWVFKWDNKENEEEFIKVCCHLVKDLGFDALYLDSAKHIGWNDMQDTTAVGNLPDEKKMQWITSQVRERTGRPDISIIGEKCDNRKDANGEDFYKTLGITAGVGAVNNDKDTIYGSSIYQNYSKDYASGSVSGDDNDGINGAPQLPYEERLKRINNALFACPQEVEKLPCLFNMSDIFGAINDGWSFHGLMERNKSFSGDGSPESHWENLFMVGEPHYNYRKAVNEKFAWSTDR